VNEEQKVDGLLFRLAYWRKVDKISETDTTWACHSGEPTAREERQALAIVDSLTTNPYCS
jgi:hypothetical protein